MSDARFSSLLQRHLALREDYRSLRPRRQAADEQSEEMR